MKKLKQGLFIIFAFMVLNTQNVQAKEVIAVISDNLKPIATNYIIYPEMSNLVAQDVANKLNQNGRLEALPVCNSINNTQRGRIRSDVLQFTKEYKNTYNVNYQILRRISYNLDADYILLISSGVDIESKFLSRTGWDMIPIAGENCVNPAYRVISEFMLIDPNRELILIDKNYDVTVKSKNMDLAMPSFSPSVNQLNRLKGISTKLAYKIIPVIETELVPELVPQKTFIENVRYNINGYEAKQTEPAVYTMANPRPTIVEKIRNNARKPAVFKNSAENL